MTVFQIIKKAVDEWIARTCLAWVEYRFGQDVAHIEIKIHTFIWVFWVELLYFVDSILAEETPGLQI